MKLIFEKDQDESMSLKIRENLGEKEFSYIEMIKSLRDKNIFEDSEFSDNISQDEKDRVNGMLARINSVITEKQEE